MPNHMKPATRPINYRSLSADYANWPPTDGTTEESVHFDPKPSGYG